MLRLIPPILTTTVTPIGSPTNNELTKKRFKSWGKKVVKKSSSIRKAVKKVLIEPFDIKKKLKAKKKRKAEEEREQDAQKENTSRAESEGENPIPPSTVCPEGGEISNSTLEEQARLMEYSRIHGNSNANNNIKRGPSTTSTNKPAYSLRGQLSTRGPMKGVHSNATVSGVTGGNSSSGLYRAPSQHHHSILPNKIPLTSGKMPKDYIKDDRSSLYRVNPQQHAVMSSSRVSRTTEKRHTTGGVVTRRRSVSPSPVRTHGSVSSSTTTHAVRQHQSRPASPSSGSRIGRTRSNSYSDTPLLKKREKPQPSRVRSPSLTRSIDPPPYTSKVSGCVVEHQSKNSRHRSTSTSTQNESLKKVGTLESTRTHASGSTPRQRRREQREHSLPKKLSQTSENKVSSTTKELVTSKKEVAASKNDLGSSKNVAESSSYSSYASLNRLRRSNSLISVRNGGTSSVAECMAWHPTPNYTPSSSRRNSYGYSSSPSHKTTDTLGAVANTTTNKSTIVTPHVDNRKSSLGQSSAVVESSAKTTTTGSQSLSMSSRNTTPTSSTARKNTPGQDKSSKTSSVVPATTTATTTTPVSSIMGKKDSTSQKSGAIGVEKKLVAPAKAEGAQTKSKEEEKKKEEKQRKGSAKKDATVQANDKLKRLLGTGHKEQLTKALTAKAGGVVGLRNLGNTCYMSCIIQCLSHTLELSHLFLATDPDELTGIPYSFAKLLHQIWFYRTSSPSNPLKWVFNRNTSSFPAIAPHLLKNTVDKHLDLFYGCFQHDAQEFMRYFVSCLHEALNKNHVFTPAPNVEGLSNTERGDKMWAWNTHIERSPVAKIFMGQLMSTLSCSECDWTSVTFDPFWDIALPFPKVMKTYTSKSTGETNPCTDLEKCFLQFCHEEVLNGDEMPICGNCKKPRQCTKKMVLHRIPPVLVLVLKRFTNFNREKLHTIVGIPHTLNLRHVSSAESVKQHEGGQIPYELYATANHIGTMSFGHYTALVKHFTTDQWYSYNDSYVSKHGSKDVSGLSRFYSTEAYVLFYRRAV